MTKAGGVVSCLGALEEARDRVTWWLKHRRRIQGLYRKPVSRSLWGGWNNGHLVGDNRIVIFSCMNGKFSNYFFMVYIVNVVWCHHDESTLVPCGPAGKSMVALMCAFMVLLVGIMGWGGGESTSGRTKCYSRGALLAQTNHGYFCHGRHGSGQSNVWCDVRRRYGP